MVHRSQAPRALAGTQSLRSSAVKTLQKAIACDGEFEPRPLSFQALAKTLDATQEQHARASAFALDQMIPNLIVSGNAIKPTNAANDACQNPLR